MCFEEETVYFWVLTMCTGNMSWVIKGTGSVRRFFWVPITCVLQRKLKVNSNLCISNRYKGQIRILHPEAVFLLIWYFLKICQLKVLQKYGLLISQVVWCVCLLVFRRSLSLHKVGRKHIWPRSGIPGLWVVWSRSALFSEITHNRSVIICSSWIANALVCWQICLVLW